MILTLDVGEALRVIGLIILSLLGFYVVFEVVVGYFYDHYCGDKSTKEYKERNK